MLNQAKEKATAIPQEKQVEQIHASAQNAEKQLNIPEAAHATKPNALSAELLCKAQQKLKIEKNEF